MSDELLRALGRVQREDDAAGLPSGAELSESLTSPIDDTEAASLLDDVFAAVDAQHSEADETEAPPTEVVELAPRRARVWVALAVAVAAAALLWVVARPSTQMIPEYSAVSIAGGPAEVRGSDASVQSTLALTAPGDVVDWRFAPATPNPAVDVGILVRSSDGDTRFVEVESAEVRESGAVRIHGPLDEIVALAPGEWTVDVLFAAPGGLPADAKAAAAGGDWQSHRIQVTIAAH